MLTFLLAISTVFVETFGKETHCFLGNREMKTAGRGNRNKAKFVRTLKVPMVMRNP